VLADRGRTPDQAGNVVTHVNNDPRLPNHGEESIKIGDAIGFGGRQVQAAAGVVQGSGTDPADAAVDGVENRKQQVPLRPDRPFLLFCAFPGPHGPWLVPEEWGLRYDPADIPLWNNRFDDFAGKPIYQRKLASLEVRPGGAGKPRSDDELRRALACNFSYIELIDHLVGRLVERLQELGLYDSTAIVFTADHGDMAGSHGFASKGAYMYDEIYRVPMLVRVPGARARRAEREPVNLTDVTATAAHLVAGRPVATFGSGPLHGQSMVDFACGRAPWPRPVHFAQYHGDWYGHYSSRMVTDGDWKLVWNLTDRCELYDLRADPDELRNRFYAPDPGCDRARRHYFELLTAEAGRYGDAQLDLLVPDLELAAAGEGGGW
jgi:arylsulfatase A-like enzyme